MTGKRGGKAGVRKAIDAAAPAAARAAGATTGDAPTWMFDQFEMRPDGLFKRATRDGSAAEIWLSSEFEVQAETRNDEGLGWGLLLNWRDRDGIRHEEAFPRALFAGECAELRARLADGGLRLNNSPNARQAFGQYLNVCGSPSRARSVNRVGWHTMGNRQVFVLPNRTFGEIEERIVLQSATEREHNVYNEAGTLDDWRYDLSRLCMGNSRLLFAVSCAFAAPLLGLLGEDGGGFNLRGGSRTGKSTALRLAASVCGGLPGRGAAGYTRQWRTTGNGIEATAAAFSDGLLLLDEMGQVDGKEAGEIAYMLANGAGKARAGRTGAARPALNFRILFLSTGEVGLADKNAEAGRATKAGQEVRLADIPSDAGAGYGAFEHLHGRDGAAAFASELQLTTARQYGTALPAYLAWLVSELRKQDGFVERLRERCAVLLQKWLQVIPDAGGQVRSVGHRFALVGIAGEVAREAKIVDWTLGAGAAGAEACFRAWLGERGTAGAAEEAQAVRQLISFVTRHGSARFDVWNDSPRDDLAPAESDRDRPPPERFRTQHRAGWRRWETIEGGKPGWHFFLTAEGMREALAGLAPRESVRTLAARKLIVPPKTASDVKRNNLMGLHTVPGHGKVRLYDLAPTILGSDDGAD